MSQKTFRYGNDAVAYLKEHGGSLRYMYPCGSEPGYYEAWWDALALETELVAEAEENFSISARFETEAALYFAGLTKTKVDLLLVDWQD